MRRSHLRAFTRMYCSCRNGTVRHPGFIGQMTRPHRPRTIVFGLDGYDFELALQLAQRGQLPWLSSQLQRGTHVSTRCATLPGSEWVNTACGVSAAHHGYLHTTQLRAGTYEEVETDASVVRTEPFYVPLARSGVGSIVVDLPVDRPRPQPNLSQVVDWGSEFQLWGYTTAPRALRSLVARQVGEHPFTRYGSTQPDDATLIRLHETLSCGTVQKGRLIRALMRETQHWSFLFAGFGEIHKAGHFFWQYQDPTHPGYRGPDHPLAGALADLYQRLDTELRQICADVDEDVNVIVVADRGMRANHRGDHLIAPLLQRWELYSPLHTRSTGSSDASVDGAREAVGRVSVARRIKQHIPVAMRPMIRRLVGQERADWRRTQVFPVAGAVCITIMAVTTWGLWRLLG